MVEVLTRKGRRDTKTAPAQPNGSTVKQETAPAPAPVKQRRRPPMVALGIALIATGGVAGGFLLSQGGHAEQVVMLRHSVTMGHPISRSDLATTQMTGASGVDLVPANEIDTLLGRYPASDLPAGTLVTSPMTTATIKVAAGTSIIGIPVKAGQMPGEGLAAGETVSLILGTGNAQGLPRGVTVGQAWAATVSSVGTANSSGITVVDVAVDAPQSTQIATAVSTSNISIVLNSASTTQGN